MPAVRRRSRRTHRPIVPLSMVRIAAYSPTPPLPTPPGQVAVVLRASEPVMPRTLKESEGGGGEDGEVETGIKIIAILPPGDVAVLAPITAARLLDEFNIEVRCADTIGPLGVYIPYNDQGFCGINGGMLNPGELSIRDNAPGPFPWCCAVG